MTTSPLERWRLSQGPPCSRIHLARRLSISRNTIIGWELGQHAPNPALWASVENHTGISLDEMLTWRKELHSAKLTPAERNRRISAGLRLAWAFKKNHPP